VYGGKLAFLVCYFDREFSSCTTTWCVGVIPELPGRCRYEDNGIWEGGLDVQDVK